MVKELGEYNFSGIRINFFVYHKGDFLSLNKLLFSDIAIWIHSSVASTDLVTKASHPIITTDPDVLL